MAFKFYLLTGVLLLASAAFIHGSFLEDLGEIFNTLTQITCPEKHLKAIDNCHSLVYPFYQLQADFENDNQKMKCCSRLAALDCVGFVTRMYCGESTGNIYEFTTKFIDRIASGGECSDFASVANCTSPFLMFFLIIFVVLIISAILKCLVVCICGARRHWRLQSCNWKEFHFSHLSLFALISFGIFNL